MSNANDINIGDIVSLKNPSLDYYLENGAAIGSFSCPKKGRRYTQSLDSVSELKDPWEVVTYFYHREGAHLVLKSISSTDSVIFMFHLNCYLEIKGSRRDRNENQNSQKLLLLI